MTGTRSTSQDESGSGTNGCVFREQRCWGQRAWERMELSLGRHREVRWKLGGSCRRKHGSQPRIYLPVPVFFLVLFSSNLLFQEKKMWEGIPFSPSSPSPSLPSTMLPRPGEISICVQMNLEFTLTYMRYISNILKITENNLTNSLILTTQHLNRLLKSS